MAGPRKKKDQLEAEFGRFAAMRSGPLTPDDLAHLRTTLARGISFLVSRAARVVKERTLEGFERELSAAFTRFLDNPVKTDPGCEAKLACLEALDTLDHNDPDLFLTASRLVQMEPSWGPPVDTGTGLRARAVRALAHMGHADILLVAGDLLGDPAAPVRQAAAESLAHAGDRGGAGLLLLASRRGDDDPVVHTAYLSSLFTLAPDWALPRLRTLLLGPDEEKRELAAIALGNSGRDDAASVLIEAMEATPLAAERALAIRALGLHRSDRALDVLVELIATGGPRDAEEAVRALAPRRFEARARSRIEAAVAGRGDARLSATLATAFADDAD
jgi:HEAT repeat protein